MCNVLTMYYYFLFFSRPLFEGDNEFCLCLKESFPNLKTRKLTRVEWGTIRRLMGKPRRYDAFFELCASTYHFRSSRLLSFMSDISKYVKCSLPVLFFITLFPRTNNVVTALCFVVPSRCSSAFFAEERTALRQKRQKMRLLQQRKLSDVSNCKDLPDEIPLPLIIGTKVTGKMTERTPLSAVTTAPVKCWSNDLQSNPVYISVFA